MIAVKIEGRLGNQLFQYAFIYAAAKKLKTNFYLDKSVDYLLIDRYFNIEHDFCYVFDKNVFAIKGYKNIFSHHLRYKFYHLLEKLFRLKTVTFDNSIAHFKQDEVIKDKLMYQGFFQSEVYFEGFQNEIKYRFTIKDKFKTQFKEIINQTGMYNKYIVVHIRRGDYFDLDISLPISYYKEALSHVANLSMDYVFVSDDPAFVEREFAFISNKYVSNHSEIIDLQFLINADVCILSNSSFSWWGAWLNNKANKQVFVPQFWLGFKDGAEYPAGIFNNLTFNEITV
ncbi:MAG TPA: alpha-1,2-fucosyltransferase [Mucilaginibacter sp.]